MAITVMLCENDDYGSPSGICHRLDFSPMVCTLESCTWPPEDGGIRVRRSQKGPFFYIGREKYQIFQYSGRVGNIYWNAISISGVDAVRLMNYVMKLKYWRCTEGEQYIYDQFEKREPIDPLIFSGMDKKKVERLRRLSD